MNYEQYKHHLRDCFIATTGKDESGKGYNCPCCPSGTGKNGTGVTVDDKKHTWKCWSCGSGGDIYDLIGQHEVITEKAEQYKRIETLYGTPATETVKQQCADYTDFFLQANKNLSQTDYAKSRGISDEVIKRFNVGFQKEWRNPAVQKSPATPRLIIPTSSTSYVAIDARRDIPEHQEPYKKIKVGSVNCLNIDALKTSDKPIFIVEGELDALSIVEVGGEAIAIGGTSNVRKFIEEVRNNRPKGFLVIYMDNDVAGEKASKQLEEELTANNVNFIVMQSAIGDDALKFKDANEFLISDRDAFKALIELAESKAIPANEYPTVAYHLTGLFHRVSNRPDPIQTNFSNLNAALSEGLNDGLYIIGAISSLGKTSFVLQLVHDIAKRDEEGKHSILFYSLEMSRDELLLKTLSRHRHEIALETNTKGGQSVRSLQAFIKSQEYRNTETSEDAKLLEEAVKRYKEYAQKITIVEGVGDVYLSDIRDHVESMKRSNKSPILVIDYLQLLQPQPKSKGLTDKQHIDDLVKGLKRISRDFNIPVIAISSLNRQSYKQSISMEAFKESGLVEYSSDVLIGLQLEGVGNKDFDVDDAKAKNPREVELVILKNRNGRSGEKISFKYYAISNYFCEA